MRLLEYLYRSNNKIMNYKNLIKSRQLRVLILSFLGWIPDIIMLRLQYWIHIGLKLNITNPKRFTEKIQVYKLKYRNAEMLRCTDKYTVREYVKEKGYGEYLIPLIGIYDSADVIDFDALPNTFVAKTTDGSGSNEVLICRDKSSITKEYFKKMLNDWMSVRKPKKHIGREWAYENNIQRRIIIEELIGDNKNRDICDYKFFCFNGTPHYCQLIQNRSSHETIDFYDMEWSHLPFYGLNPKHGPIAKQASVPAVKPRNYDIMKNIAQSLSTDFPFVRVDLYNIDGKIYFGELTFYPASGYGCFTPDNADLILGNLFDISSFN